MVARWTLGTLDAGTSAITIGGATIAVGPAVNAPTASSVTLAASLADILALLPPDSVPPGLMANGTLRVEALLPHANPRDLRVQASADVIAVTRDAMRVASGVHATAWLDRDRLELQALTGTLLGATVNVTGTAPAAWVAPWLVRVPGTGTTPAAPEQARLSGTIDAPLAGVVEALGINDLQISGAARISVELTATAPTVDAIRGVIASDAITMQTRTGVFTQDGPWRIAVGNGRAVVEALALKGSGSLIRASGHVELNSGAALDVQVRGTASMSLLDGLVAPRVDGSADVDVRVGGSINRPSFDGVLTLHDVSALSSAEKLVLAGVDGRITFRPGSIESVDLRGQLNGGSVAVSGSVAFDSSRSDRTLRLTARDVFVEYPQGLRNRISADLVLSGGLDTPTLRGTTTLLTEPYRESLPRMARLLAAFSEPARGGTTESASPLGRIVLDVALLSSIPLRLDNSLGQVELLPRVRLVGTVDRPGLIGSVAILDGSSIRLQSRTYVLTDSRLDFDPDDGFVPQLHVLGTTRVGDYTITLQMSGPADAVEMNLSSDPPLPERDLQVMLLTGQAPGGGTPSEGSRQFAITALSSDVLGIAGQALGLDYVRIGSENFELVSSDPKPATRLTISKTLLSRFELIFSDNLDNNTTTWIVAYRPLRDVELRVASRDNLERTFEVRHQFSFGPGGSPAAGVAKVKGDARTVVPQETVDAVVILGEPDETVVRLRSLLALAPGRIFDYRKWLSDHERIRQFYIDAGYLTARIVPTRTVLEPTDGTKTRVTLEYRIARGPATAVVVKGWSADAAFIKTLRVAWAVATFDQFAAEDMGRVARDMLIDAGYVLPVVQTTFSGTSPGPLLATVNVQSGPKVTKKTVTFEGMSVFSEQDLRAIASTPGTTVGAWRDPIALCLVIADLYSAAGYRGAVVTPGKVLIVGSSAVLPIRIVEGPATRVGAVTIAGVPAQRMAAARAATGLVQGALLPSGEERAARLRLERHFRNLGYRSAKVVVGPGSPRSTGLVDVSLTVNEGSLHIIRTVLVEGVHSTRPSLVDRAVQLKPGDAAGQDAIAATQRRLYQLGVFNAADIRIEPLQATAAETGNAVVPVNAVVSVVEPRRYQFVYGVEFSNAYGPIFEDVQNSIGVAADVRDRNFLGRGMTVSLGGRYDPTLKSMRALFTAPSLWSLPIRTNVYLGWRDQKSDAGDAGVVNEVSRSLSVEQRWRPNTWVDVSWGYLASTPRFFARSSAQAAAFASNGILAAVSGGVVLDRRDNLLDAKRGWFHSSSLQVGARGIGSDLGYQRYVGQAYFFASAGPLVSATAVRFGALWNMNGNTSLAVMDLRFRTGGGQTVRGYPQEGLAAGEIQGIPIGGTRLLVLNQELRVSVSKRLQGVFFVDAGNVFGSEGIALGNLKVGVGFGIRIMTPLAPLRADFGFPMPRRPGDPTFRWYVSVGQIF
jgi:outer membrane protein assembly factor BamA